MAIYDISNAEKSDPKAQRDFFEEQASAEPEVHEALQAKPSARDRLISTIAARLFFLLLFLADMLWTCYALLLFVFSTIGRAVTMGRYFKNLQARAWVSLRRSLVCGVSLFIALFSPAFGIMIACTYFLMYDKSGIEEVVPSSLQSQFKEFFPN